MRRPSACCSSRSRIPTRPIWFAANSADAWVINHHATLPVLERQVAVYRDAASRFRPRCP